MPKSSFNPKTVRISGRVWMVENLNVDDGGEGIYRNPETNEYYYTWDAAVRVAKGIPGWHLPTAQEWDEAALACGATEKPYESNPSISYKDAQALKARLGVKLAGHWYYDAFSYLGSIAVFWTASEFSPSGASGRFFNTGTSMYVHDNNKTSHAYSVRLVKG